MTNFSNARTIGDIVGAFTVLVLMLCTCILSGFLIYAVYDGYQDSRTIKIVKQGNKTYTGFVSSHNGSVTVISGKQKTILNSVNGKIEIDIK